jgi:putative peptidoglycan lipid II flippase
MRFCKFTCHSLIYTLTHKHRNKPGTNQSATSLLLTTESAHRVLHINQNRTTMTEQKNQSQREHKPLAKSLTIATFIMMASVLLSRVAGLIREQVLAYHGGTSSDMDAYVTAFMIPELLNHFLAGGFLSITFIPIFQKHILSGDREKAWKSMSNLLTIGSIGFIVIIPLMMLFTADILKIMSSFASVFGVKVNLVADPEQLSLTIRLTQIILPAQILFYWGAFFSAVQMAEHKFFLPALSPLCYNFGIILGGVILGPLIGIEGFAWGVLFGAFLGNILIQLPGALQCGFRYRFRVDFSDKDFTDYIKKTVPLILGLGMVFSNEIFFRFFGSFLPEGATSSINYALRTMLIVVAVFGQASGVAFFPYLSKMAIEHQFSRMSELLNSMLFKIALFLLPLSGIMFILSKEIISILFQRGSFNSDSVAKTSVIFAIYLTGAFAFSASMIVSRTFYALQNTLLPMLVSTPIALLSIPLYIFSGRLFQANGIAIIAVLSMTVQFLILYFIWIRQYRLWKDALDFFIKFIKVLTICICSCTGGYYLKGFLSGFIAGTGLIHNLALCILTTIPVLFAVFGVYELTKMQSLKESVRGLLQKK